MCKTVINRVNQFSCRVQGFEIYESRTGEVYGMTEKDIVKAIKSGELIRGLTLNSEGKVVLDEKGFFQTNIIEKTTLTNMKPINGDAVANIFYTVIGVEGGEYQLLNSRFGRMAVSKEKLATLFEIGVVQGGCKINDKGELVLAEMFNTSAPVVKEEKQPTEPKKADVKKTAVVKETQKDKKKDGVNEA